MDAWLPKPETVAILEAVIAVLREYADYWPLTCRQVFYRLVGAHDFAKTERAYKRLCEVIVKGRRARLITFDAIRDDGVSVIQDDHYSSADGFLADVHRRAAEFTLDKLARQRFHVEVLCEAAGMQPQLATVANEYSIPVYSSGGFDSLTAKYELARRIIRRRKPTIILHLGDYDPSGVSIFDSLAADVAAFVDADKLDGYTTVDFRRVALTEQQVDEYALPTAPPKDSDSRSVSWRGQTCQLEALAPDDLAETLRDVIEGWLDREQLADDRYTEFSERQRLTRSLPPPGGTSAPEGGAW
jgi:hypothetical protein